MGNARPVTPLSLPCDMRAPRVHRACTGNAGFGPLIFVNVSATFGRGGIRFTVRHGIIAAAAPGMTPPDAPRGQKAALDRAMLFQRLHRIGRAGRLIATVEPHPGAEDQPIGPHGQGNNMGKRGHARTIGGNVGRGKVGGGGTLMF